MLHPIIFVLLALLPSCALAANSSTHFAFEGMVDSSESYTHRLPEGLYFHLVPIDKEKDGWHIVINKVDAASDDNFVQDFIVNHNRKPGEFPLLDAWHQQGQDITFVLSDADRAIVQRYDACNWPVGGNADYCRQAPKAPVLMGFAKLKIIAGQTEKTAGNRAAQFGTIKFSLSGDYLRPHKEWYYGK